MSLLYAPLWTLLRVYRSSSRSLKTAGGHDAHASTNPCAVAHVRDILQSWYTHLQLFVYSAATQRDSRWTALDFSMLETLVPFSINTHKSYFQLRHRDHPCCVIVRMQNQTCQLQKYIVVRQKRVWFAKQKHCSLPCNPFVSWAPFHEFHTLRHTKFRFVVVPLQIVNLSTRIRIATSLLKMFLCLSSFSTLFNVTLQCRRGELNSGFTVIICYCEKPHPV